MQQPPSGSTNASNRAPSRARRVRAWLWCGLLATLSATATPGMARPGEYRDEARGWAAPAKFEPAGDRVYHGAALPDYWCDRGLEAQIESYNRAAGKDISVVTWFASAYEGGRVTSWPRNYAANLDRVHGRGAASLVKFSTHDHEFGATGRQMDLRRVSMGDWDPYFVEMARSMREFGAPVFLSINHEMNGNWYPHSAAFPGADHTPDDWVAAWQHIVAVFRAEGAHNVAFVWSPNVPDVGGLSHASYYPGDEWVDWVGVSFYSGNAAGAMDHIYATYSERKPFFVTEWATAREQNRFNGRFSGEVDWIREFFAGLHERYPRVRAISWFNWNNRDGDYRLERVPDQALAYAADIASPRFLERANALIAKTDPALWVVRPHREAGAQEANRMGATLIHTTWGNAGRTWDRPMMRQSSVAPRTLLDRVRIGAVSLHRHDAKRMP